MRVAAKTYTITDDAPGVTVEQDASVEAGKISESQAAKIVMTVGRSTWTLDTAQGSPLAALIRKLGRKGKVRGRKPSAS